MSAKKKLSPGDIVKTPCVSCGTIKEHKIIALIDDDEETFRVECTSCDTEQEFEKIAARPRARKPAAPTIAKAPRGKVDPAIAEQKEWVLIRPNMNVDRAVAYDMNGRYNTKTVLNHSAFGLGQVTRVAGPHKVEVLFESGKKLLRCH
jgi:hypothetical protein